MAPSNLQGLNIVHTVPPPNPYLSDQDLLSVPPFPDLAAQLDLWTNLNFQSDEPLIPRHDDRKDVNYDDGKKGEDEDNSSGKIAETASHENVVTGTVIPPLTLHTGGSIPQGLAGQPPFDIGSLLAGFGIDPFQVPALQPPPQSSGTPSLAQLLAYHSSTFRAPQQPSAPLVQPIAPAHTSTPSEPQSAASAPSPTAKRARTSRASNTAEQERSESPEEEDDKPNSTPLTASEDKRRRNTAASARFRLKKKEREAALERKAKELEVRVSELEKECEALRRENGWLKGLVVGVTGAGAVQQQQQQVGAKRSREETDMHLGGEQVV